MILRIYLSSFQAFKLVSKELAFVPNCHFNAFIKGMTLTEIKISPPSWHCRKGSLFGYILGRKVSKAKKKGIWERS
jgi:predicted metallo-beta-lactamase superfamily hydrolase